MFKSKIDFNAFDAKNEKVKDLEQSKVKALSKSSVKKLLAQPEVRTPFHLILDYFKDKADKPLDHFVGFGVNKKMDKHFEQIEMKSGKLDKSMSASQKDAAMGEAYAKEENGKKILCFEPHPSVKIPRGKWGKILKALKSYLGGVKAVVVFDGEIIEDKDSNDPEEGTESKTTDQNGAEEDPTAEEADQPQTDNQSLVEQFKAQLEEITKGLKETLPKEVIPKIKNRSIEATDLEVVEGIKAQIEEFEEAFQEAADKIKGKLKKMHDKIAEQAPKVDQILQAVERQLKTTSTSDSDTTSSEDDSIIDKLLARATKGLAQFERVYDGLKKDLEESVEEAIEGGDALLESIGR